MAIKKSAQKAHRKSLKRNIKNSQKRRQVKELLKSVRLLISQKKNDEAKRLLPQVYKLLDKSAKTELMKKNTASRLKSRITKLISKK